MMVTKHAASRVADGYSWPECPRWHDGSFYFADLYAGRIMRLSPDGAVTEVVDFTKRAAPGGKRIIGGGFGFLPDGRMIVNSMYEQLVLVWDGESVETYADLRAVATGPINDMVVDRDGRAYITQLGYDLWKGEEPRRTPLLCVEPDGTSRALTHLGALAAANGIAISADGRLLVTAEVLNSRLTAFDRDPGSGALSAPRMFALLDHFADGICLDEEGAVWAAQPGGGGAVRVLEGGTVTDEVTVHADASGKSVACVLGGPDRRTLFICCGFEGRDIDKSVAEARGSIWEASIRVGAGAARP